MESSIEIIIMDDVLHLRQAGKILTGGVEVETTTKPTTIHKSNSGKRQHQVATITFDVIDLVELLRQLTDKRIVFYNNL